MLTLGAGKPVHNALGGDGADVVHLGEFLHCGRLEVVQGAEALGQDLARLLPHLADAEGKEQPGQVLALGLLDGGEQVLGGFFAHALQLGHVLLAEEIQVAGGLDQPRLYQVLHHRDAQTLNVHGIPAGKVGQVAQQLSGTLGPGTADVGAVLIPGHRRAAFGAHIREAVGHGVIGPLFHHHGQYLRDDLPRLAHQHGIADADVLLGDKILVVEGGIGHRGAGQTHRLQHRLGGEHAGTTYLNHNIGKAGRLYLWGILVGGSPPGELGCGAQGLALGQIVHLDDRPVDVKGVVLPALPDGLHLLYRLLNGGTDDMGNHLKALVRQVVDSFSVAVEVLVFRPLDVEYRNVQPTLGGNLRVQLPQGPGGGVAGIGKQGLSPLLPFLVEGVEHLLGHIDLAPDNESSRYIRDRQGNRLYSL